MSARYNDHHRTPQDEFDRRCMAELMEAGIVRDTPVAHDKQFTDSPLAHLGFAEMPGS